MKTKLILAIALLATTIARAEYLSVSSADPRLVIGGRVDWTGKIYSDGIDVVFGNAANHIPIIGSDGKLVLSIIPTTLNATTFTGAGVTSTYFNNVAITAPASAATFTLGSGTSTTINGGGTISLGGFTFTVPGTGTGVLTSRQVIAGTGLSGGGTLASDVTLSLPNVGTAGLKTFATGDSITTDAQGRVSAASTVTRTLNVSGLGLSGGGSLAADRTFTLTSSSNPGAAASILATNSSGQLALVDLLANSSTFNLVNTTATTLNIGGAATTLSLGAATGTATLNNATVALGGTLLNPVTAYNTDVGQLSKKFKALYASELWVETLVAQNTIATIGGRLLIGPTTTLIADLSIGATTMDVKHNQMSNGDRVYLEANGAVEFIAIASVPTTITGGYRYTITRNLDGSGANAWSAGDAVFNTGTTGNGFIDLYSVQAVKGGSQAGPTIVGNVRNSSTYNDWTEHWAIGNLVGLYGYGSTTYGAGFGKYASANTNFTIDDTNGFRVRNFNTVLGQWYPTGQIDIGEDAVGKSYITIDQTNGVRIANGSNVRIKLAMDGSGYVANTHMAWDASGNLTIDGNATIAGWSVNSSYLAKDTGTNSTSAGMAPSDYPFFAGATYANRATAPFRVTPAGAVTATSGAIGGWTLGATSLTSGSGANTVGLDSGGTNPAIYAGSATPGSAPFRVTPAGALTATSGTIGGWTLGSSSITSTGITMTSGASAYLAFGATPPTSAMTGTGIFLDSTGLYALSSNTQNATFTSAGITAGGGSTLLDINGLTITPGLTSSNAVTWKTGSALNAQIYNYSPSAADVQLNINAFLQAANPSHKVVNSLSASNDIGDNAGLRIEVTGTTNANPRKSWASFSGGVFQGVTVGSTSTPTHMLDVYGTGWFQSAVNIDGGNLTIGTGGTSTTLRKLVINGGNGTAGGAEIDFAANSSTGGAIGLENSIAGTGSNTKLTLYSSNTTYRLYGMGAGTLTTDASGNITASSDERKKDITGAFTSGLDDLAGIKPITYRWKVETGYDLDGDGKPTGYTHAGFSAQNVMQSIPLAVGMALDGSYTLDERPLLAAAINAINEQQTEIEELRAALHLQAKVKRTVDGKALMSKRDTELSKFRDALRKSDDVKKQRDIRDKKESTTTPTVQPTPTTAATAKKKKP